MTGQHGVCVVGSLNLDRVVHAPRFPRPGETLLGGPYSTHPGGKGANQAVAAARLGAAVSMIGAVGDDAAGRALRATLEGQGVGTEHVVVRDGAASGTACITVDAGAENTIVVAPGANATLQEADVDSARSALRSARVCLAQLEVPPEAVARAFALARTAGVKTLLNAAPARELPGELLRQIDVLIVNLEEARVLTREETHPTRLLQAMLELGVAEAVLTCGAAGAWRASSHRLLFQEAFPVEAVDSTAAGDAFCGAYAAGLAAGRRAQPALRAAAAAGALAATRPGAIPALPAHAEVEGLLDRRARPGAQRPGSTPDGPSPSPKLGSVDESNSSGSA